MKKMTITHTKELIEIVDHVQKRFLEIKKQKKSKKLKKVMKKNKKVHEILKKLENDKLHPALYIATVEWLEYCGEFYTKLLKKRNLKND